MTVVVNRRHEEEDVYIGRGSKWGNPFTHTWSSKSGVTMVGSREEAIAKYRTYILSRPDLLADLEGLRGKRLGCYCKPMACHGDVLLELLNG